MPKRVVKRSSSTSVVTWGEAFEAFKREKTAKGLAASTMKNYEQSMKYFKEFMGYEDTTDIKQVTKDVVTGWINAMLTNEDEEGNLTTSAAAVNHYLRDVRAFLYWCMADERKYLEHFKVEMVRAQEPRQKTYTQEEIKRLLAKPRSNEDYAYVEWRNWMIVNLVYDMGARAGTILEIKLEDINLNNRTIYLRHTKNRALAHASISSRLAKMLKEYIQDWRADCREDDYLFCNISNEQLTYNALAHSFAAYCSDRHVEKHSIHGLRHSFATTLAETTNGDMVRVQKALGHSSIEMARKYVNLANVSMGEYDDISPLARTKDNRGRPKRSVKKAN